jgi:hypothetical protein
LHKIAAKGLLQQDVLPMMVVEEVMVPKKDVENVKDHNSSISSGIPNNFGMPLFITLGKY